MLCSKSATVYKILQDNWIKNILTVWFHCVSRMLWDLSTVLFSTYAFQLFLRKHCCNFSGQVYDLSSRGCRRWSDAWHFCAAVQMSNWDHSVWYRWLPFNERQNIYISTQCSQLLVTMYRICTAISAAILFFFKQRAMLWYCLPH